MRRQPRGMTMKQNRIFRLRRVAMVMPVVASVCWLQAASAAQSADPLDAEMAAHDSWLATMAQSTGTVEGCFRASYPNVTWQPVECKVAHPRVHPVHINPSNGAT